MKAVGYEDIPTSNASPCIGVKALEGVYFHPHAIEETKGISDKISSLSISVANESFDQHRWFDRFDDSMIFCAVFLKIIPYVELLQLAMQGAYFW